MNINLVFEGKNYNFDIPNNVTIEYIKELSSKIFNSDKALLDLLYNNQKIENKDDNTLIRDLIPEGETNAILTVQIDKDLANSNKNEIIPLVSLKNKIIENNENEKDNGIKENLLQKEKKVNTDKKNGDKKIIHIIKSNKKGNNNSRNKIIVNNNDINLIKREFDIKIFQTTFINKHKELLELMKEFNNKIKEVYLSLYKKYKNSGGNAQNSNLSPTNNSSISSSISIGLNNNYYYELSIYEKKLINFQEKQINYYKKLLELIKKYDKNKDVFQLNDFYTNLIANNNNIKSYTNKEDTFDPNKFLKFKKLANKKIFLNNNSLLGKNLSSLNINNDNHLPILKNKNLNSSLEKKNISYNFNNISSINSIKTNSKGNIFNNKLTIDKEKEIFQKNNNNINKGINTSKITKNPLSFESKLSNNNNNIKNNNLINNKENNNNKDKDKEKDNENNSYDSDNLSEKDLVDSITINENKNKSKIAPIPLHIRNSVSNNIMPRKFSVINNSLRNNNIINNINNNNINNGGIESVDKTIEEKKRPKLLRFCTVKDFQNKFKNTPIVNKKITINEISQNKSKRKGLNDSINEGGLLNMKKIKDIDISSMTVNDSNFIRDKQKDNKKKNNKDMNKFDFFM